MLRKLCVGFSLSCANLVNSIPREARYVVPRSASLPVDAHQRLQQYNQMRNMQSNMSAPGVLATTDRGGVHTLSSGNNMGMMGGINRGIPMARPGFQGVTSPSGLNSGSMLSPGMVAMPNTVNMHSEVSSNQVNSMMRPRDGFRMMRVSQLLGFGCFLFFDPYMKLAYKKVSLLIQFKGFLVPREMTCRFVLFCCSHLPLLSTMTCETLLQLICSQFVLEDRVHMIMDGEHVNLTV